MKLNSIRFRLVASALLIIGVTLPIIGVALNQAFESKLKNALQQELSAYVYSILAVADVEDKQLVMPEQLLENQFNVSQSGLYALISTNQGKKQPVLWQSSSLLTLTIPKAFQYPQLGAFAFYQLDINNQPHAVYSFSVSFVDASSQFPFTLHIIKDLSTFTAVTNDFRKELWLWLLGLMAFFMMVQIAWLMWSLKPLKTLKKELNSIETGKAMTIEKSYPQELDQVTKQLNTLLKTEQSQRQRFRNALSDLAHSLKGPLAVIQSQDNLTSSTQEQLRTLNQMIEHQLKRAQSAGESSWHLGVAIKPVVEKLTNTLRKLYPDVHIETSQSITDSDIFKGDEVDLMEMLGNLLDNACKAANNKVLLSIDIKNNALICQVEDDGIGISDNLKEDILTRGTRSDTYSQGHGIGLAIVKDLVESYQGQLTISQSHQLRGASFTLIFHN